MAQLYVDDGSGWRPLGSTVEGVEFISTEEDLAPLASLADMSLTSSSSSSFSFTVKDGSLGGFFETLLLEADLAEHDAYEDTLAMESIAEQDRLVAGPYEDCPLCEGYGLVTDAPEWSSDPAWGTCPSCRGSGVDDGGPAEDLRAST